MNAAQKVCTRTDGAVATVIFNNPERRNAMSLAMWLATAEALEKLAADPAVRVVVLTGAGDRAFVSGADISEFESERGKFEAIAAYNAAMDRVHLAQLNFGKPLIAMIRGYCLGGGLNLAAGCDLRIANETARFGIPAAKLGLGYGYAPMRRLLALVGPQFAQEILFTARQFDAEEALRMGLVNRVVPDAEIESCLRDLTATIAANAPLTIRAAKCIVREAMKDPAERDLAACDALVRQCFESDDYQEGRLAFLEKRRPVFTGK
ncbi:MAG: enoyl-CoA hydratase [Deltaproteobacteria bacterium]|nr:enoyl-CoA hydratase [Deltaproteobacteria bacterium]